MNESVKQSRIKPSKIVMVIGAVLMVAFIVAAIVLGVNIPRTTRLRASDGGKIVSLLETDGEDWLIATDKSNVIRLNAQGQPLETIDVPDLVKEELGDIGYVRSINKPSRDSKDLYVFTSKVTDNSATYYLIQLREKDGKLTYNSSTTISGVINAIREKDGYLYVLNDKFGNMQIRKYDVNDLSAEPLIGYVCKVMAQENESFSYFDFSYLKNINVLSFEIIDEYDFQGNKREYVHIVHPDGIIRFDTNFTLNKWQDKLESNTAEKLNAFIAADDEYASLPADEQSKRRDTYTAAAVAEVLAMPEYVAAGIKSYDFTEGTVGIDFDFFEDSKAYLYGITEEAYRGVGYDTEKNQYYIVTRESFVYVVSVEKLPSMSNVMISLKQKLSGITLSNEPKNEGYALFYNDALKVGYIAYTDSNRLSRLDFKTGEMTFTTKANDDIQSLIQNGNGQDIYYNYKNHNEAEAGEFVVRRLNIEGQENYFLLQGLMTTAIVLAVVCALVGLLGGLCAYKPGFSDKFQDTMRLIKKHWAIYVIIAASFSLVAMFCYYPAIGSIALSFFDYTVDNESKIWNNFANYAEVFGSPRAVLEFGNMCLFLATDIFTALLPPLVFAFFLTIMRNKQYSAVMRTLLFIPGIIPGIATTLIWKSGIYDYPNGVINMIIKLFNGKPFDFMHDMIGTRVSIIMMGFPFVGSYLIFYGAMMNVPDSYYEAAELDGITVIKRFIWIDVPLIFAQIKYVLIMTFISSVQNFGRTYMTDMNNVYNTDTPIHTMYKKIQTDGNYGLASAYATVLFIFLFAATVFNMYSQKRDGEDG